MKWSEAKDKAKEKVWAFLELRPTGRVLTKEQYDYAMYYAKHTGIDCRYIRSFEEEKGKYSHRNYLGGIVMDKVQDMNNSFNHGLTITERKNLIISGVKKIESFDNEEFLMETTLGFLVIKGSELEIIKLDTYQGNVSIKGRVDSLMYLDENLKKDKDSSLLNKLFK